MIDHVDTANSCRPRTSSTSSPATSSWTGTTSSWTWSAAAAPTSTTPGATGRILDFFSNFATLPIGYNHPKMADPEFREALMEAALTKPSTSDIYTEHFAHFVETFSRLAIPKTHADHLFFVEGGTLAIENTLKTAFDWKVRKNLARGKGEKGTKILHFKNAFHGRSGYTLSMTNTADPRKTQYFPKFDWPRLSCPSLRFPVTETVLREVAAAEEQVEREIRAACAANARRHRGAHPRADPGRGRRQPLPAGVLPPPARARRRARVPADLRRGPDGRRPDRLDVVLAADGRRARPVRLRQEDAGLRLRLQPPHRRRPGQRLQGLLAHQLDLGRQPRGHGPLRPVPRDHRRGEPDRERARRRRAPAGAPARAGRGVPRRHDERARPRALHRLRPARQGDARPHARRVPRERHDGPRLRRQRHPLPAAPGALEGRGGRGRPEAAPGARARPRSKPASGSRRSGAFSLISASPRLLGGRGAVSGPTLPDVAPARDGLARRRPRSWSGARPRSRARARATRLEWTPGAALAASRPRCSAPSSSPRTRASGSTTASTGTPMRGAAEKNWEKGKLEGRRLDDHPAARQEPLPLARPDAVAQAARARDRAAARARALEEADPRALPERHRVRAADLRRRGGGAALLRQVGARALARGGRDARGGHPVAAHLRPRPPPGSGRAPRAADPAAGCESAEGCYPDRR